MFNDDQLATIAAAMSILQKSMQSNSPTSVAPVPQEQQHLQNLHNNHSPLSLGFEPTINFATSHSINNPAQQLFPPMQELNHHYQPPQQQHQAITQLQNIHPMQQQQQQQAIVQLQKIHPEQQQQQTIVQLQNLHPEQQQQQTIVQLQNIHPEQQQQQVIAQLQNIHPKQQHQLHQQPQLTNHQPQPPQKQLNHHQIISTLSNNISSPGICTNLLGFMGLYVGNLSPDLTKEQLEKIFSKYGEPVKAHRLIRSPVAFIKYDNVESPRAAIQDLYGVILPELTLNQDQPLKLHFDRNDYQLKINYRPTELPPKYDNGECYGWRTTVCRKGKNCPKRHILINRGIDFQMWMIKSAPTTPVTTGHAPSTYAAITSSNTAATASIPR